MKSHDIERRHHGEGTRLLHKHLDINPPQCLPFHLKDKFHKLAAVFLMTDGYLNRTRIQLICTDKILTLYFLSLFKIKFNLKPTSNAYLFKGKETSLNSTKVAKELLLLSPTYNTYPKNKTKEEYYASAQPSLSFLENECEGTIIESLRIAMSCEGSIFPEFQGNIVGAHLQFACSHPKLLIQWKMLFEKIGITSFILKSKITWSGVKGLAIKNMQSIKRFIEIGGFVKEVKITGKSKHYKGIEKNKLLQLLVEMRDDSFYFPKSFTIEQKNAMMREMIVNPAKKKEYWKKYVEKPEVRLKNRRNKIRRNIISFIREEFKKGKFPTLVQIQQKFGVSLLNYFKTKSEAYRKAGIEVEDGRRITSSPRPFMRKKIVKFMQNCAKRNYYPTWEDLERKFNICYTIHFPSIKDAYEEAGIPYPGKIMRSNLQ